MAHKLLCNTFARQFRQTSLLNRSLDSCVVSVAGLNNNKIHMCDGAVGVRRLAHSNSKEPALVMDSVKATRHSRQFCMTNLNQQKIEMASSDPDQFGVHAKQEDIEDEGDRAEEEYIKNPTRHYRKLRTKEYAALIKEHLREKRLKDALNVLEKRMLREDRVKPENYIYSLLISACAKAGYTRKAFSLYAAMRKRGLKVKGGIYTSLFNACANAPSSQDGLGRAQRLRESLIENAEYTPNVKTYNAMIKAYGRWGDVKTAYLLADEMVERKIEMGTETYNFLLQACASDLKYGFRHALITWHKMLRSSVQPDYYTFHTLLRCVRDCSFGDLETMQQVLNEILDNKSPPLSIGTGEAATKTITSESGNKKALESGTNAQQEAVTKNPFSSPEQSSGSLCQEPKQDSLVISHKEDSSQLELPNLLASQPHLGSLISLAEVSKPHERFLLLGGLTGFLDTMKQFGVTPNIESFTTMLEVIPPTLAAEKQLISYIRRIGLKADIDFFNILIKKRAMRFDYENSREVLSMIRTAGLRPDIVTYGVLALSCRTVEESRELLQQMHEAGVKINIEILGAMLRQGCAQKSFAYITEIMQISLDENIKPNDVFLTHLHKFYNQCAKAIDARHPTTKSKEYKKGHSKFCEKLRLYYEEHGIAGLKLEDAIKKVQERPYDQYKEEVAEGIEELKNRKLAQKQKLRKYIKKIKLDALRDEGTPQIASSNCDGKS